MHLVRGYLDQAQRLSGSNPIEALDNVIAALRIVGGERAVMEAMQVMI